MVQKESSFLGMLARIFWMMLGPLFLLMLAYNVIKRGGGWWTEADFVYLGMLAAVALARWVEFRCGNPQTVQGEPATSGHLRRYLIGVAAVGMLVWVIANGLGNYVLA